MKTYVITLSKVFPAGHSQAGKPTNFAHLLGNGLNISYENLKHCKHKIYTIRTNYQFWEKRIAEVQAGRAVLSVRRWKDKPYRSPQEEIERLTSADGVGIQKLTFGFCSAGNIDYPMIDNHYATEKYLKIHEVASNDGLSIEDFKEWFKGYDLSQPMAIIHFTKFRY